MRFRHILIAMPFAMATPALAQETQPAPPDAGGVAAAAATTQPSNTSVTIGAGGVYMPDYEGSNDYHFVAAPGAIGSVDGFNFTLAGNRLSVDLIPNQPGPTWDLQLGPVAVVNFNRSSLKSIEDLRIRALGKRSTTLELGGYAGIGKTGVITSDYDRLSFSISYRKGVTGAHRGGVLSPTINYFTPLSRQAAVGLFVSAERAERKYAAAYYDVDAAGSVASGLPTFRAQGGWKNYTLGALGTVALSGDLLHGFKLVAGGTYTRLLNDFGYSPVVRIAGDKAQWMGVLGLAYTF